jgi:hypothetical protein
MSSVCFCAGTIVFGDGLALECATLFIFFIDPNCLIAFFWKQVLHHNHDDCWCWDAEKEFVMDCF